MCPGCFWKIYFFNRPSELFASTYFIDQEEKALVNIGSVGQPRDGDIRASYGLFCSTTNLAISALSSAGLSTMSKRLPARLKKMTCWIITWPRGYATVAEPSIGRENLKSAL